MVLLAFTLFSTPAPPRPAECFDVLRRSKVALAVTALIWLLPILNFFGWWDSYFSFSLYSGNTTTADVYVTKQFVQRLPAKLKGFVRPVTPAYNPQWQTPFILDCEAWALDELGTPGLPEPRGYRALFSYLNGFAASTNDLYMYLLPLHGPVLLCRGENASRVTSSNRPSP
jgi:hypothetical protein